MWPGVEPVEGQYNHTYLQAHLAAYWRVRRLFTLPRCLEVCIPVPCS